MAGAAATRLYQLRKGLVVRDEWPDRNFNVGVGEQPPFKCRAILCNIFPRNWALFIAVVEIFRSVFSISISICRTFIMNDYVVSSESPSFFTTLAGHEIVILLIGESELAEMYPGQIEEFSAWRYVLFFIVFLFSIVSIVCALLLWRGAKVVNPYQLRLWFIYKFFISLVLIPLHAYWFCSVPKSSSNSNSGVETAGALLFLHTSIISYFFTAYSLFVVFVFVKEIWSIW